MIRVSEQVERSHLVSDQMVGITIVAINNARFASQLATLSAQDAAFTKALLEIESVRVFLGSPQNILGSDLTKHGEIAEHVEVGVRNARALVEGVAPRASFNDVGRTDPTDYMIDGEHVQSKFINGTRDTLRHVYEHMDKYPNFGRDGNSYYHIPKDQYDQIQRVLDGRETELADRAQRTIREQIHKIEVDTGKPFNEVVKPAISDYREVQKGVVHETLDKQEQELGKRNQQKKDEIVQEHQPNLMEAANAAVIAGVVGGTMGMSMAIWAKSKAGKNPFKGGFSKEDWHDVGLTAIKGTADGAIAGAIIYSLTNYAGLAAPFASALVSAGRGVSLLNQSYLRSEINAEQFMELSLIACSEAAIVGIATALGQTLIPIPLLGAAIGSMAGRMVAEFTTGKTAQLANQMLQDFEQFVGKLDATLQKVYWEIQQEMDRLGKLTVAAFDLSNNYRLVEASIALAEAYGVEESRILRSNLDLERYLLD
jgi:hypothetical protein